MSQGEILDILKKEKKPLSAREIIEQLDINPKRVYVLIKILLKYEEIKCIEIPRDLAMKLYRSKRRMRLYYVVWET